MSSQLIVINESSLNVLEEQSVVKRLTKYAEKTKSLTTSQSDVIAGKIYVASLTKSGVTTEIVIQDYYK